MILLPAWRSNRVRIDGPWQHLSLYRLGDVDLFLSKLMRDDPIDQADVRFIVERAKLTQPQIETAIRHARVPAIPDIQEQFAICSKRFLG
ncbi:MAG: hypothetical protein EXS18_05995 [Verrucomicrobiae bacterium]|nr:hypothetical protein [Verrucomicrobiae bacterium]